ncbi:MAG: GspE/PulE family protein, partial [Candidatus Eutrophobiaceae bacterium]
MSFAMQNGHLLLGESLIHMGAITRDQLDIALTEQKGNGDYLGKVLVQLGFLSQAILRDALSGVLGRDSVSLAQIMPDEDALALIPESLARRLQILPFAYSAKSSELSVAMANPCDLGLLDELESTLGDQAGVLPFVASETEIEQALDRCYGHDLSFASILREIESGDSASVIADEGAYVQPMVRLVNALLCDAIKRTASDIHIEPEKSFFRIRYRIDGVLRQIHSLHKRYWSAMLVRIKVLAELDIAETRTPQDGRFSLDLRGHTVDFRVSTFPTLYGENIVLRVLDRSRGILSLKELNLDAGDHAAISEIMRRPQGMLLLAGPTGSGKTTTLYAMLSALNEESVNIMTLEDPVECPTTLIRQASLNQGARLSFSAGMRALMRQDPDILLIGEIRDEETACMAIRASMTGHRVFSTLHSNSAIAAIPRLRDMGVRPETSSGNISGIIAQRLLRRLCGSCRAPLPAAQFPTWLTHRVDAETAHLWQAQGCEDCVRGYLGRVALMEVLRINRELDALMAHSATGA